ncbi:hypothetical protein QFZ31_005797 [Neobacillus niacini]|uniref:hypothetical protein n=1 Tax=Neobacillus driksii TaxID=3035913 RepID=UPI0027855091|nr:hypothetical protein [Neobacillus niacini]MDQ0975919.1 hypothetical protein [Neobacillus niacini]
MKSKSRITFKKKLIIVGKIQEQWIQVARGERLNKQIVFNNKEYEVTEEIGKVSFKDKSNQSVKINFSFSKNPDKNKLAKDGLTMFFTEVFSKAY